MNWSADYNTAIGMSTPILQLRLCAWPSAHDVTPNRRGVRSRELVLDAAERVMAEHGFEAATLARVVEEAGIPMSSVYHYYGSKDGILLAVMERGAERFFADLPDPDRRVGRPRRAPGARSSRRPSQTLERHPDFLRLLIVFAIQPPRRRRRRDRRRRRRACASWRSSGCASRSPSPSATTRDSATPTSSPASRSPRSTARSSPGRPTRRSTLEWLLEPLPAALVGARRALRPRTASTARP